MKFEEWEETGLKNYLEVNNKFNYLLILEIMHKELLKLSLTNYMFLKTSRSILLFSQTKNMHLTLLMTSTFKFISSQRTIFLQNIQDIKMQFNSLKISSIWSMPQKMKEFWKCPLWLCLNIKDFWVWLNLKLEKINPLRIDNFMIWSIERSLNKLPELVHRFFSIKKNAKLFPMTGKIQEQSS